MFFWILALLLFLGIFLILLEALVPHGLSIIAGFVVIGASCYYCFLEAGPRLGVPYLIFAMVIAAFTAYGAFRLGIRSIALAPVAPNNPADHAARIEPAIGQRAHVSQPLRPTGAVEVAGERWAARAFRPESEIEIGEEVEIRGRDSIYLIVERCKPSI